MPEEREVYLVSIGDVLPVRPRPKEVRDSISAFFTYATDEVNRARHFLEKAVSGTVLPSHYSGQALSYQNKITCEVFYFSKTYIKVENAIYVKLARKDILGEGAEAIVKLWVNINTQQPAAAKLFHEEPSPTYFLDFKSSLFYGKKSFNPFKKIKTTAIKENIESRTIALSESIHLELSDNAIGLLKKHSKNSQEKWFRLSDWMGIDLISFSQKIKFAIADDFFHVNNPGLFHKIPKLFFLMVQAVMRFHSGGASIAGLGYVHRDIKPENFLVLLSDTKTTITLIDEESAFPAHVIKGEGMCATPYYLAPEVLRAYHERCNVFEEIESDEDLLVIMNRLAIGKEIIVPSFDHTFSSDIFSLGKTVEEMIEKILPDAHYKNYRKQLLCFTKLMCCFYPNARPKLQMIVWAFFIAYAEFMQLSEENFLELLSAEGLSDSSYADLKNLAVCYIEMARFTIDNVNTWPMLAYFHWLLEDSMIDKNQNNSVAEMRYILQRHAEATAVLHEYPSTPELFSAEPLFSKEAARNIILAIESSHLSGLSTQAIKNTIDNLLLPKLVEASTFDPL